MTTTTATSTHVIEAEVQLHRILRRELRPPPKKKKQKVKRKHKRFKLCHEGQRC